RRTQPIRDPGAAGVAGYLPKPINAHELLALLARHASHARP
ncbi:hybrid sensor histidine kinase/response regulator, partial [Xanthomonas perforans]